jgi:6-pyruvoyltetrahydropterin/6-carboxytetrahydropterin synthase
LITFKEFTFEAAHALPPFSKLHGHSFSVEIAISGKRHPRYGWAADLYEVDKITRKVREDLHEGYLNEVPGLEVPSLENLTHWLWMRLKPEIPGLCRISVRRGANGHGEGCVYHGPEERDAEPVRVLEFAEAS